MMPARILPILVCLAALLTPLWLPCAMSAESRQKPGIDRDQPIHIVSDRLDAYSEKRMIVFSGNAVATQGARTIRSDRLTLHYKEEKKSGGRPVSEAEAMGNVERVEAAGHVTITEGDRVVTGEMAVFDQDARKITMTGSAVMREGASVIRGDRIIVFLDENRGVVEGAESGRVTATIYPGNRQEQKR
jgi:lipopolysaccharide export system protein LptA